MDAALNRETLTAELATLFGAVALIRTATATTISRRRAFLDLGRRLIVQSALDGRLCWRNIAWAQIEAKR